MLKLILINQRSLNITLFIEKYLDALESKYQILSGFIKLMKTFYITRVEVMWPRTNDFGLELLFYSMALLVLALGQLKYRNDNFNKYCYRFLYCLRVLFFFFLSRN